MNTTLISLDLEDIKDAIKQTIREEIARLVKNVVDRPEPKQPEYYERKQLCELAHISSSTLWRMEADGTVKKVKCGRRNLYLRSDIEELLSSGKLAKYSRRK